VLFDNRPKPKPVELPPEPPKKILKAKVIKHEAVGGVEEDLNYISAFIKMAS
jgi:hypothetical protein